MPTANQPTRNPLVLWFCALAVLGYLRFLHMLIRAPGLPSDAVAWIWFGGATALGAIGILLLVRDRRRPRSSRPAPP